ncbi:MAG: UDP-N-acetylglucosamine 2-epimerase (non-hydrolyzing) [Halanaerobium sp.]|nr:UDP-N-acetylglucosamine 2-epimerase (non-hydrolyzing) [Halanaerobium sp.]
MHKVMTIFGTRPEAIKMAPVVKALEAETGMEPQVVVTAQHREMLDQVLELFGIEPLLDLDIMRQSQSLSGVLSRSLQGLERAMFELEPDLVLVHGDTATTFAGALAAYYQQIPVGHVEAGLRTRDKYRPFPEEANRHLTGVLADYHFAPTRRAADNLLAEAVPQKRVFVTGNTVIDALLQISAREEPLHPFIRPVIKEGQKLILVTAHRRENWGEPLEDICRAILQIVDAHPDVTIAFPVHLNPAVRETVFKYLINKPRIYLLEPLDYLPFAQLMQNSYLLLSDSGGIQEEAPALGKPVLVMRQVTERPEAVEAGTVKLVGTDPELLFAEADKLLNDEQYYQEMSQAKNPFGDGRAAQRIVKIIRDGAGEEE